LIDGLVVVDKEAGWTSHDAVARCRRIFGQRRVGHSGTLDPGATGILLVGLGRVTRLLRYLTALPKSYTGEVILGVATSTLDDSGEECGRWDMSGVTVEELRAAARSLTGPILQVPPMVSAVKIGGQRLHALARQGIDVDRPARPVVVHRFEIEPTEEPGAFRIEVECSSGTYIRVLAADLGALVGGGAHLRNLRRTAIGSFSLADARSLERLEQAGPDAVLAPLAALRDYPVIVVDAEAEALVRHGRPLARALLPAGPAPGVGDGGVRGEGPWAIAGHGDRLLAVYEVAPDPGQDPGAERIVPAVVLVAD
jgi:tRNA pseudouridine55 synthase